MCNRKIVSFLALALAIGCTAGQPTAAPAPLQVATPLLVRDKWEGEDLDLSQGCSTVYATDGQQMLGGNNEDSIEPMTKVWFVPKGENTFGLVLFGYGDDYRAQGGMNDQGLFFDFLTGDKTLPIPIEGKQPYPGTNFLAYDAMVQCATVACVVEMFEKYYDAEERSIQIFFGDATGESAIIEPQAILRQRGGYQVATNFYQSMVAPENRPLTCRRYKTASEMLEGSPNLSVEYIRDVMAAVHQKERHTRTVYTNVYDLVNRKVYLYYFSDFEHVAVLDLEEELAKGEHTYDLPALFPPNPEAQEFFGPGLRDHDNLVRSRRVDVNPAFLAAYVGEYAPDGSAPRAPGEWVSVVLYGTSLMMVFPDHHRYVLYPQSEASFFVVTWHKTNLRYEVPFSVDFGVAEATRRVLYMDFVFGPGNDYVRNDRLNPDSFVPYMPRPAPTDTPWPTRTPRPSPTPQPSATAEPIPTVEPTPALSAESLVVTPPSSVPVSDTGFPWDWMILLAALLAAAAGWAVIRKRQSSRR